MGDQAMIRHSFSYSDDFQPWQGADEFLELVILSTPAIPQGMTSKIRCACSTQKTEPQKQTYKWMYT